VVEITISNSGMLHLRNFIKLGYYPILEIVKAILLIAFFQFGLSYVAQNYKLPTYPNTGFETILVYTLIGFVILGWFLGERKRFFLVISYFVTFQIIGLALIEKDWEVLPRVLTPVFFTYLTLFLFKSPTEFEIELEEKRRQKILKELSTTKEKLKHYEFLLKEIKQQYEKTLKEKNELEKLLRENPIDELQKILKEKEALLSDYRSKMEKLQHSLERLKENNRQLWELLEEVSTERGGENKLKEKLREVRKELKSCLKDIKRLQKKLKECNEYSSFLEVENNRLTEQNRNFKNELQRFKEENEKLIKEVERLKETLKVNFIRYLNRIFDNFQFTTQALKDLTSLEGKTLQNLFKHLKKIDRNPELLQLEKLEVPNENIFRVRFPGGRLFLKRTNKGLNIVGILEGEDSKTKDRFIRERFS